jgi:fructose PTS system EIIBC or EIIC component
MQKKILAVTACPTGIAHTYMSAEALSEAAKKKGIDFKVETRGASGIENQLTKEEIDEAEAIIIAADVDVEEERFQHKSVTRAKLSEAIKKPEQVIDRALEEAQKFEPRKIDKNEVSSKEMNQAKGLYKHLLNGVSYMLPLVVVGGILIAISFAFGIKAFEQKGTLAAALMDIGGNSAFALMVPILAGFIAFSIADKAGLTPGLIGGMLASKIGAGFLGGILAGFLAGYVVKALKDYIRLPKSFQGIHTIVIIPVVSSLIVGLLMIFVIGTPIKLIMDGLAAWLKTLGTTNAIVLGLVLGAMMASDMGGPINKAAYTFGVGLLGSGVYEPMAAIMAAGMTPPLGIWLATLLARKKFSTDERETGKAAGVLGISFITEGAIPFAAADPIRVIPSLIAGSAITGALSMAFDVTLRAPHGGIFVLAIPNVVSNIGGYVIAITVGTIVTAILLALLKRNKEMEISK